jgi:hypothetical protein
MALTKVSYSMITGAPVNVIDYGADPTGVADSQPAIQAAINSGATDIVIPEGTYRVNSSITIEASSAVRNITGLGTVVLKLYTAVQSQIFLLPSVSPSYPTKQFLYMSNLTLDSNGSKTDGLQTYGILSVNTSYSQFNDIRATNFSGAGLEIRGCVYVGVSNYTANSCFYGLSFQQNTLGTQCTSVRVDRAYVSGCTRGVTQTGAVDMIYNAIVMEFCGSTTTTDGALHIAGGTANFNFPYFEANYRNIVAVDAEVTIRTIYGDGTGVAPDSITYVGTAFNQRGWDVSFGYKHTMARLDADSYTGRDLEIGTNLVVPLAGGSVKFGNQTMAVASGTLTSATWTTTYTIPAVEITGTAVNSLAMYEYTCYAGSADLSTGFDSGTIMNGTLRSYSGSTPAWLRLAGGNLATVIITGTAGQFSCTATNLTVGMAVTISGTFGGTGSITGYTNPKTYYIIATNNTTTFTLSETLGGAAIVTTAGTPTGLTYTIPSYVQMNVTGTSYGLLYKIVMRRMYPG